MIIKFKSLIMDETNCPAGFDPNLIQEFNDFFKGKYCYLLRGDNTIYAVAFDTEEVNGATVEYYENIIMSLYYFVPDSGIKNILLLTSSTPDWDNGDGTGLKYELSAIWSEFIDQILTDKSNSVDRYIALNRFEPDSDLTIDDLKRFRTWIADCLYEAYVDGQEEVDEKFKNMVNYYRNEMNDDATNLIHIFSDGISATATLPASHVGCGCNTFNVGSMTNISVCDILDTYRKNIHDYMVEQFSKASLWMNVDDEPDFLIMFKKYIDEIILNDFPLYAINPIGYADCACLSDQASNQEQLMKILKNLSISIQYMIDGSVSSHKNFVYENLYNWANSLYEIMRW